MSVDPKTILTKSEMVRARPPDELAAWIAQISRLFGSSKEAKQYARLGRGFTKRFYEEVRPLGLLVQHLFDSRSDVLCIPNLGNENYDAIVRFTEDGVERESYIEFTYAKEGYEESLRMEVLNERGSVNALAEVKVTGTKATGHKIEIPEKAVLRDHTLNKNLSLIKQRVEAKTGKDYGSSHSLVVVIDDYLGFQFPEDETRLRQFVNTELISLELNFSRLYLLGASGKSLLEFNLPRYNQV
jgi:hypothetical protein